MSVEKQADVAGIIAYSYNFTGDSDQSFNQYETETVGEEVQNFVPVDGSLVFGVRFDKSQFP